MRVGRRTVLILHGNTGIVNADLKLCARRGVTVPTALSNIVVSVDFSSTGRQPTLMGSVAERVVREAPCSFLTVRAPRQKAA
jgi:nucleotide-binding universal stress UspA family protein